MVLPIVDWLAASLAFGLLQPMGLLAALVVLPLVVLYMLRPDPSRVELPTMRFLHKELGRDDSVAALENLPRSALLLLQILVFLLLAGSLATPYIPVTEQTSVGETVIVVDASASMATETGEGTRFERAIAAAKGEVTEDTSIVVASADPRVVLDGGTADSARLVLDRLRVDHVPGDLGNAVARATTLAGDNARIVVVSDLANADDWRTPVQVARARGQTVDLRQIAAGGEANVGIVDLRFETGRAVASIRNFGPNATTRTMRIANSTASVSLAPNDTVTRVIPIPTNGGTLELTPHDSFSLDDNATIAAPPTPAIRVLLLTNDPNRELVTAFRVMETVDLTVKRPPTNVQADYDVVVFGNVETDSILQGTLASARDVLRNGGGVVIQGQPDTSKAVYGDMLLLSPTGVATNATLSGNVYGSLTEDIAFPAPDRYLTGHLTHGEALLRTSNGTPVLARGGVRGGQVLYYGYVGNDTTFETNFMYPVFWKRVAHDLSGWPTLRSLNHETGGVLTVQGDTQVRLPSGDRATGSITLLREGVYRAGGVRHAAVLLDAGESDVAAGRLQNPGGGGEGPGTDSETIQFELTPILAGVAGLLVIGELGFLRWRGQL